MNAVITKENQHINIFGNLNYKINIMTKLNKETKLRFYQLRTRKGDTKKLSNLTGYTTRFINYVKKGERNVNEELASAMYNLSRRRTIKF